MPAIAGLIPDQMVHSIAAFLDFCYIVRLPSFNKSDLAAIDDSLAIFMQDREIFKAVGVRPKGFSLPRLHSIQHYHRLIQQFGAPNGISTSITESMHIEAVKEPWRRSNKYEALGQMLVINQRMDKILALRSRLVAQGLLSKPLAPEDAIAPIVMDAEESDVEPSEKVESIAELARSRGMF